MGDAAILVLNGPSLNRLGRREPHLYGTRSLGELEASLARSAAALGAVVQCRQTNHEGQLLDWLLSADDDGFVGVVLNAGAWAHTSLAIADAVRAIEPLPVVEVHITNTAGRDAARHASPVGAACWARLEGFGVYGYELALQALIWRRRTSPG